MEIDLKSIHPVNFYNNKVLQSTDIGSVDLYPIAEEIQCIRSNIGGNIEDTLRDYVINNICNLANTFIIKILEDYIHKNEIAYIVDFNSSFNVKDYLYNSINKDIFRYSNENICNIIYSNIIFILNQFIQFYVLYKLVYTSEGVDLFDFLYKDTYGDNVYPKEDELKEQNKYVFCVTIMNNILEEESNNIRNCCVKLKNIINNIKIFGGAK